MSLPSLAITALEKPEGEPATSTNAGEVPGFQSPPAARHGTPEALGKKEYNHVKAETKFLQHLNQRGYFTKAAFDPQPVFEAARKYLGLDATSAEQNEQLTTVINRLVDEGFIRFEYSQDSTLHPKDVLDHWRLNLTPAGETLLK